MTVTQKPDAKTLAEQARARGAHTHVLDGAQHRDRLGTLDAIAAALSFPDWFGRNLDALYDCLTDLSWLPTGEHVLIWIGSDVLKQADPKSYLAVHGVLSDAQRALASGGERADSRRLTVVLADE
ncbi:barstar (barnase inhibitor) [Prauserella shujinwangii]|uniref:Barstar (Barnase inhibitor) n=1 Tax=Prauserella shujinwangii TaxID=1453103 RepID=A0A2T0LU21_9PSEU|nr:barstar family protein [Prauserella shujinwangii]PRX47237.1 barstar (barnase inhibitor) [Prauserella shujinwangii]